MDFWRLESDLGDEGEILAWWGRGSNGDGWLFASCASAIEYEIYQSPRLRASGPYNKIDLLDNESTRFDLRYQMIHTSNSTR